MKKIAAQVIADSKNEQGDRITSLVCTFPRFILAELNTHRMFSKNSASSRAVPYNKMIDQIKNDPFIPIAYQKEHTGMQGTEYITDQTTIDYLNKQWLFMRDVAIDTTSRMTSNEVTKQICNRPLETWMWHTCIITATEFENFFKLRCPQYGGEDTKSKEVYFRSKKDTLKYLVERGTDISKLSLDDALGWLQINKGQAEIHMMALAEAIWDAMNESIPKKLKAGEWHIPFGDNIDEDKLANAFYGKKPKENWLPPTGIDRFKIKVATARCARVSYINYEGRDDYEADIKLYDRLIASGSDGAFHASPFEHCSRAMNEIEYETNVKNEYMTTGIGSAHFKESSFGWVRNFKGFIQLRALIEK